MHAFARLLLPVLLSAVLAGCGEEEPPTPREIAWREHVVPFLEAQCTTCHGNDEPDGDVSFEDWAAGVAPSDADLRERGALWERMAEHVKSGVMPPEGLENPVPGRADAFLAWVSENVEAAWMAAPPDPGRVTMRRLSRYEYRNTVRDLLGIDYEVNETFPTDDVGYGFDHIGDVLSMPPILFEKYLGAAEDIAAQAVPVVFPDQIQRVEAEDLGRRGFGAPSGDGFTLWSNGELSARFRIVRTGTYTVRVKAAGQQAGPEKAKMALFLGLSERVEVDVPVTRADAAVYEHTFEARAGMRSVGAGFVNDYYKPNHPDKNQRDRNLWIDWIEVEGPLGAPVEDRVLICEPVPGREVVCTQEIVTNLLRRAFRRPPEDDEIERYTKLAGSLRADGEPFEAGIQAVLQAALVAPQFLFRVELDGGGGGDTYPVDDHALASRLSYFLWSSLPDDELMALADAGTLRANLRIQVDRMLGDEKARALVENFAGQWLELRRLETASPDPKRYKQFDEDLRAAMQQETELFVAEIFGDDRSILDLIDAPFTYVNETLARHYGFEGVKGPAFRRYEIEDDRRGGLLGHASILTLTSYATRTSPTQRGKWMLEEILGTPPPPPPPGVGVLEDQAPAMLKLSLRERLAKHREDPSCAVCHAKMDVLGFGLENYDGIGAWRTKDGARTIDVSGRLPDGRGFARPAALKAILRDDPGFPKCFAEKLLTYALGRGLEPYDRPAVRAITDTARKHDYRFRSFVHAVVASDAFTMRRGAGGSP